MELRLFMAAALLCACAGTPRKLVIPEDMRKAAAASPAATAQRPAAPPGKDTFAGATPNPNAVVKTQPAHAVLASTLQPQPAPVEARKRGVLRMIEHGRVWEVELPEGAGGYEMRIPLGAPHELPTAADEEMLGKPAAADAAAKSLLSSMARVSQMYTAHQYELALIEVVDLEQQYPKEERIQAMKGSLYQKLGKSRLARDAWKKALELDPADTAVAEALRGLKEE